MTEPVESPARAEAALKVAAEMKQRLEDSRLGVAVVPVQELSGWRRVLSDYKAAVDRVNRATDAEIGGIHRTFAPSPAEALPSQTSGAANKAEAIIRQVRKFIAAENKYARLSEQGVNTTRDDADFQHAQLVGDFSESDCDEALRVVARRRAALAKPASEPAGGGAREALGPSEDWSEKLAELYVWTGSAFLAGEKVEDEAGHKSRLYGFLCGLIGYLMLGRDAALSSPASSSPAEEAQGAASALRPFAREAEFWDHAPDDYNFGACGLSITVGDFRRARDAASRPSSSLAEGAQS